MAARKSSKKDLINLTKEDFERKGFKVAPGGTYTVKITRKSEIKPGTNGNVLHIHAMITKGTQKKATFFDAIAPTVGWKVAQLLQALKIKKTELTLQDLLKLVMEKDLRAVLKVGNYQGTKKNEVVQWLPLVPSKDEEADLGTDDDEDLDEDDEDLDEADDDDDSEDEEDEEEDDESDDSDEDDDEEDDEEDEDEDLDDEDDEDTDDEDDDDEDEPPARRGRKAAAKPVVRTAKKTASKPVAQKSVTRGAKKTTRRK